MGKTMKFTYDDVKDIIEKEGYILVSDEYINANTHLDMICPNGHEYRTKLGNFRTGYRCNKCCVRKHPKKLTYEFVKNEIEKCNYKLLSDIYINAKTDLKIKCDKNHEFYMKYDKFKIGQRCPYCRPNRSIDINYCKEYAIKNKCKLLTSSYEGVKTIMTFECEEGHLFKKTWTHFQAYPSCPICSLGYKGEKRVMAFLDKFNIKYIHQYKFEDCYKIKRYKLPFDFYLPDYNICIEYDGEQHFKPIDFAGKGKKWANQKFENSKLHDEIKNKYCADKNIKLIRIAYYDFDNIENILKNITQK